MTLIDPAEQGTWPDDLTAMVRLLAERCASLGSNRPDLPPQELRVGSYDEGHHAEQALRELLGTRPVAMYHATRYLPHEVEAVANEGLQPLTLEYRSRRLDLAIKHHGAEIGEQNLEDLRLAGPLMDRGHRDGRLGKLWGVSPVEPALRQAGPGMTVFLESWGGEAFYWAGFDHAGRRETIGHLTALSVPTIVQAGVIASSISTYQDLWPLFAATMLGWHDTWNEYSWNQMVPANRLHLLHPGSAGWPTALATWAPESK